jgi:uncharacterized protein with PIN domain
MKFIADAMLGKLAKWLRLLGYDTYYESDISDDDLLRIANAEDRIILTRDTLLIRRKICRRYLFISDDYVQGQLRQTIDAFNLSAAPFSRCLICNVIIREVEKSAIQKRVPEYTYKTQDCFAQCPQCGRIYWPGTHVEQALKCLDRLS